VPFCPFSRKPLKKPKPRSGRAKRLRALARESARVLDEQIRRWQALPMVRRMNFLRVRVGVGASAL
jgi:hypothetical protein